MQRREDKKIIRTIGLESWRSGPLERNELSFNFGFSELDMNSLTFLLVDLSEYSLDMDPVKESD